MSLLDGMSAEQAFIRLMRCFCTRLAQCVVQSRMVCEARQPCVPVADCRTWFNLVIDEIGEIAAHLKQKMESYSPLNHPFSLEFTLHTADGDYLPVELWVLWLDFDHADENLNLHKIFYPQLSILLRSVLMASRFTPIYRHYAKHQNVDSFVLLYKVSIDHPDVSILGEGCKHRQLGNLPTPFGAVRMDLYYRTKMEILPSEISVEKVIYELKDERSTPGHDSAHGNNEKCDNSQITNLYGNIVPSKSSDIVASSPALEDFNCFSTSPLSQDFPFVDSLEDVDRTSFKLGRSSTTATTDDGGPLTTGAIGTAICRHPSSGSVKWDSPSGKPNSFPQRNLRQMRIRNNSFPFASLLIMDLHSSSDQFRSQILPKVPEDVAVTTGLYASSSDRVLCNLQLDTVKSQKSVNKKRHSSLTREFCPTLPAVTAGGQQQFLQERQNTIHIHKDGDDGICSDKNFHTKKKVVFGCSEDDDNTGLEIVLKQQQQFEKQESGGRTNTPDAIESEKRSNNAAITSSSDVAPTAFAKDDEDDSDSCSSDDSYVKVVPFASDSLYSDLTDFAQEVHVAPRDLASSFKESASDLNKQIDEFREKATVFDNFVASLKEMDDTY